jgi:uncharacterized alpha-E superfamily protein
MYRQQVRSRINGADVLNFLLLDDNLPRAVGCCLIEISDYVDKLPNHDGLPEKLLALKQTVAAIDTQQTTQLQLREILDNLQNKLGGLHDQIAINWFLRVEDHAIG